MTARRRIRLSVTAALVAVAATALLLALAGGRAPVYADPGTRYVSASAGDDAGGANDCSDVNAPCRTLQRAVDAAGPGDEILVASGTYTSSGSWVVRVDESVTIRGGYANGFSVWVGDAGPSVLDGEDSRRVVYVSGGVTATLEALWVTNGGGTTAGGGIYVYAARAVISGCRIFDNNAGWRGGAVFVNASESVVLAGNDVFSSTAGDYGGGISILGSDDARVAGNRIYSNAVTSGVSYGGGIHIDGSAGAELVNNQVISNAATYGAGGVIWESEAVALVGNEVWHNTADDTGGGLYLVRCPGARLEGNHVYSNTSLDDYVFYGGGGIKISESESVTLTNNMVLDNWSGDTGSGIFLNDSAVHLVHTTLARNAGGQRQGIFVYTSTAWMTNTILVGHAKGLETYSGGAATLECTLWGDPGGWGNDQNTVGSDILVMNSLFEAPGFVDPDGGDYHLGVGSAAIDAGVEAGVAADIDLDLRPFGSLPDLGADEAAPVFTLIKTGPASVEPGALITYTLWLTNSGVVTAANVVLTDALPSGAAFVGASHGGMEAGGNVSWPPLNFLFGGTWVTRGLVVTANDTIANSDYRVTAPGVAAVRGAVTVRTAVPTQRIFLPLVLRSHP